MRGKELISNVGAAIAEKTGELFFAHTGWGTHRVISRILAQSSKGQEPSAQDLRYVQLMPPCYRIGAENAVLLGDFKRAVDRFGETVDRFCSPNVPKKLIANRDKPTGMSFTDKL